MPFRDAGISLLAPSAVDPISVENIKLNWRTSVQLLVRKSGKQSCCQRYLTKFNQVVIIQSLCHSGSKFFLFPNIFQPTFTLAGSSGDIMFRQTSPESLFALACFFDLVVIFGNMIFDQYVLVSLFESLLSIGSLKASTCRRLSIVGCMKMAESNLYHVLIV